MRGARTFLRDRMEEKHRCVFLHDIGAIDLRKGWEDHPYTQFMIGRYFASKGRSMFISLGHAFLRGQPHYLMEYLSYERRG